METARRHRIPASFCAPRIGPPLALDPAMLPRLSPSAVAAIVLLLFASRVEAVGIVDQSDPHAIHYRIEGGPLRELAARFKPNELAVLEKLNRADLKHLSRLDRMVLPSEWRG